MVGRAQGVCRLVFRDGPGSAIAEEPRKEVPMGGPTDTAAASGQDEREIRALVDRMFDSWGRGDAAAAYHVDFTDDADYVSFDGSRRGTADSISSHAKLFPTVLYGSRLTGQVESVRFLTPDVAVVHLLGSIVEGSSPSPSTPALPKLYRTRFEGAPPKVRVRVRGGVVAIEYGPRFRPADWGRQAAEIVLNSSAGGSRRQGAWRA
jgi:uncharacterized protein (TIGR02246 family)